jgi:hypothetical protein
MIASWTAIGKGVHLAIHVPNSRVFFVKDKEGENDAEGSREMLWRAVFLLTHLRGDGLDVAFESGTLHIKFANGSSITAVSSAPNVLRGLPANYVVGDEMAAWHDTIASLSALLPTLESRGSFIGISSAAVSYFDLLVHDEDDSAWNAAATAAVRRDSVIAATAHEVEDYGIPGFMAWTNRGNGFRIVRMHYTCDPRKRSAEWRAREKKGVPESIWQQEYEIRARVKAGRPVFQFEWNEATMLRSRIQLDPGRPIWANLDFGFNHPALSVHQMRYGRIFTVLRALLGEHVPFRVFMNQALYLLSEWFPKTNLDPDSGEVRWCCDAAGTQQNPEGLPEVRILKREYNIHPKYRKSDVNTTLDILRGYMARNWRGEPEFQVDRNPDTIIVVEALGGGYAYPVAKAGKPEPDLPDDDGYYIHVMDTLRYGGLHSDPAKYRSRASVDAAASRDIRGRRNYVIR